MPQYQGLLRGSGTRVVQTLSRDTPSLSTSFCYVMLWAGMLWLSPGRTGETRRALIESQTPMRDLYTA